MVLAIVRCDNLHVLRVIVALVSLSASEASLVAEVYVEKL